MFINASYAYISMYIIQHAQQAHRLTTHNISANTHINNTHTHTKTQCEHTHIYKQYQQQQQQQYTCILHNNNQQHNATNNNTHITTTTRKHIMNLCGYMCLQFIRSSFKRPVHIIHYITYLTYMLYLDFGTCLNQRAE